MKKSILLSIILGHFATGCIIVEGEKSNWEEWDTGESWEDEDWEDWENSEDEEDEDALDEENSTENTDTEDSNTDNNLQAEFYTVPSSAAPGDAFLSALRSDSTVDWSQIVNITPYGALSICEFTPLFDELLLTVQVDADAPEGTVDLVIEYANGDVDLVEDGFVIDLEADVGSAATTVDNCE